MKNLISIVKIIVSIRKITSKLDILGKYSTFVRTSSSHADELTPAALHDPGRE